MENNTSITKNLKEEEIEKLNIKEQEEIYNKNIMNYLKSRSGGDLKYLLKEFSDLQKQSLKLEKEEEEKQSLDRIFYYSAKVINFLKLKELEKKGVAIRKLDLIETVYESFGKYVTNFQKRASKKELQISRF